VTTVSTSASRFTALRTLLRPQVLDRLEQVGIVVFWSAFAWRMVGSTNPYAYAIALSEFGVLIFTLLRRPSANISVRLGDWLLACTATFAPLMLIPAEDTFPQLAELGLFLMIIGNVWQCFAKFVLRRSFGLAPANRGVKVGGPYRYMRHPMYAGYLFVHLGALVLMFSWFNLLVYAIGWTAQIRRLLAEERLLVNDPAYAEYMGKVRWRLLPGLF
jgi:protein-S-isoprenylcysteine O-methyltransferase Ste14